MSHSEHSSTSTTSDNHSSRAVHESGALGFSDMLGGLLSFLFVAYLMRALITTAVPGLLKPETFVQILEAGFLFIIVWCLFLNRLFSEYLKVLELREERSVGAEAQAARLRGELKEIQMTLDQQLQNARIAALLESDKLATEARKKAVELIEESNLVANKKYSQAHAEISEMRQKAEQELELEAKNLSTHFKNCALKQVSQTIH